MIISQDTCPPPQQCLDNWDPSPCTSCQITCGPCTIYTYCGSSADSTECKLYVTCSEESLVKISGAIGNETQPFVQTIVFASQPPNCIYTSGLALFTTDNGPVNYQGNLDIEIKNMKGDVICRSSEYYNCN